MRRGWLNPVPGLFRKPKQPFWQSVQAGSLRGLELLLPPGSGASWPARILDGSYEPSVAAALAALASAGGVLYDIGAHLGFYACAWLKLGGDRVEAFEPLACNRGLLDQNLARNGLSTRVRVHSCALGDRDGEAVLVADESGAGSSSMAFLKSCGGVDSARLAGAYRAAVEQPVPVRTLDRLWREAPLPSPAALKIDVEGAEAEVLSGAANLLSTCRPAILCEVHNTSAAVRVADFLARLDYRLQEVESHRALAFGLWLPRPVVA